MRPKGRPEGESTPQRDSAEGSPVSPHGHPQGEHRSAQREGNPMTGTP
jgi:hypothetical protein